MSESSGHPPQRRRFFRVTYPATLAPTLAIDGRPFKILDICENGVRISNPMGIKLPANPFPAFVSLHEGKPIKITGRVIRREKNQVALILVDHIPYSIIIAEQAYLQRKSRE